MSKHAGHALMLFCAGLCVTCILFLGDGRYAVVDTLIVTAIGISGTGLVILRRVTGTYVTVPSLAIAVTLAYGVTVPLTSRLTGVHYFSKETTEFVLACVVIALISQMTGSLLATRCRCFTVLRRSELFFKQLSLLGLFCVAMGAIALVVAVSLTCGWQAYLSASYMERAAIKRDMGAVEIGMYWLLGGIAAIVSGRCGLGRARIIDVMCVGILVFFVAMLGIRRPMLYLLLPLGFSVCHIYPRLERLILAATCVGAIVLVTFAHYRHILVAGNVGEAWKYVSDNATWEWANPAKTELGAPFSVFGNMEEYRKYPETNVPTYLRAIPQIIPSVFYPNRPPTLSGWYTMTFFPDWFIDMGGNMGFYSVAEAYVNWGYVGVACVFCLVGVCYGWLGNRLISTVRAPVYLLVLLTLPWTAFSMRIDFAVAVKSYCATTALPVIVAISAIHVWQSLLRKSSLKPGGGPRADGTVL